jgi:hypothetical protein
VTAVEPFKVGFLDEGIFPDAAAFNRSVGDVIRLRFDEAVDRRELDRPVDLVVRAGRGLPEGTAHAVQRAWSQLADEGVLLVIGPGITDNCLAVVSLFESRGVPTINFPGTTRSRGRYGFHYQIGSLYDDGPLIARAAVRRGLSEVAVIRDNSPIGAEFFEYFAMECERIGLAVTIDMKCSPVATDLAREGPDPAARLSGTGGATTRRRRDSKEGSRPGPTAQRHQGLCRMEDTSTTGSMRSARATRRSSRCCPTHTMQVGVPGTGAVNAAGMGGRAHMRALLSGAALPSS